MSRLIDSDVLKEWIENWFVKNKYYHPYSKSNNIPIPELYDILERMPTVDMKPVRYGKWLDADDEIDWKCSLCGAEQWANSPFCPNCGAKMDLD